jgi:hypothetical protein
MRPLIEFGTEATLGVATLVRISMEGKSAQMLAAAVRRMGKTAPFGLDLDHPASV